jgi:hypothetical protein
VFLKLLSEEVRLSVVLYDCEVSIFDRAEEYKLCLFQNEVLIEALVLRRKKEKFES